MTAPMTEPLSFVIEAHGARRLQRIALVLLLVLAGLIVWQLPALRLIYSTQQVGAVGWVLNGLVLALFVAGVARLFLLLAETAREESALHDALALFPDNSDLVATALPPDSLVARRLAALQHLHRQRQPINHGALAATLVAQRSSRMNLPRFVNSSLILSGVFGTIVSLSMALVGASDLLNTVNSSGMGLVIHGMSTALSTTMTAIVCYLYFTWLLHGVADCETRLLAAVEQFTVHHLLPKFHVDHEQINHQLAELLLAMGTLVERMEAAAAAQPDLAEAVASLRQQQEEHAARQEAQFARLGDLLRQGFRLPAE